MKRLKHESSGYALITALIVTALTAALVLGFINQVSTEQKISLNDTDYSAAFYAAEAGLEKLNSDLSKLFLVSVFPTQAALNSIQVPARWPDIEGITYTGYSLTGGHSTRLTAALTASATTVTVQSTAGWPSTGFFMVDAEEMTYTGLTATTFTGIVRGIGGSTVGAHSNNAVVSRSRVVTLSEGANAGLNAQTIPFTLDITARGVIGTEARLTREVQVALIPVFQFGIFSDSDVSFFAGPDFSFGGRVHSNKNIYLAEGPSGILTLSQKVTSGSEIIRSVLSNGVSSSVMHGGVVRVATTPGSYRNLAMSEGSLVGGPGSSPNSAWPGLSLSTYNGNILNSTTGGKMLILPFVSGGYNPIELIKRPVAGEGIDTLIGQSRLANQASLRIYVSDAVANLPGGAGHILDNTLAGYTPQDTAGPPAIFNPPFAEASPADPDFFAANGADETTNAPLIKGYILIERLNTDGTVTDVTLEILNLGIATNQPNAILRFQKPRWDLLDPVNSLNASDYVPLNLYDSREARFRDDNSIVGANLRKLGIMNLIDVDVNNLRRWFTGLIGSTGSLALNNGGYILYFSDRRGNRDAAGGETGELGFEDFVNAGDLEGDPNGALTTGEDLNENTTLEIYGANLPYSPWSASTDLYTTALPPPTAAAAINVVEDVDAVELTIDVGSAAGITVPGYYRIDHEIVNCLSKAGNTLTCDRGRLGTTAVTHAAVAIDLDEDLDAVETDIDVSDAASLTVPNYYRIGTETVLCTAKTGNTLTCTRGLMGTAAVIHNRVNNFILEPVDGVETQFDVDDASGLTVPNFYRVENEIILCGSKSTATTPDTITCQRGQLGTSAAPHLYVTTNLTSAISAGVTTFAVTDGSVSTMQVPAYYRIGNEILLCGAKNPLPNPDTITCARGQQGTPASGHTTGVQMKTQLDIRQVDVFKTNLFTSEVASKNRVHYFRRAVRLVNGASPNLPGPGFTVASENPVYIQGNYNSNGTPGFTDPHSYSAVMGDAVTLLSNAWANGGDERSFMFPYAPASRPGSTSWYRLAIASGKGITFPKPTEEDDPDFGTDGGTHNFLRYLESWSGSTANYRGSLVSLYFYRQAIGPYKCCDTVYKAPNRAYGFDTEFLVPSQLPPGTPRFRDINNLAFRQMIRAN